MRGKRGNRGIGTAAVLAVLLTAAGPVSSDDETVDRAVEPSVERSEGESDAQPAGAKTETKRDRKWRMRFMFAAVGDGGFSVSSGRYVGTRGGAGVGINFEYRYSPKMGFEMGAMALASDVYVRVKNHPYHDWGSVGLESFVPLTFGINYHPLQNTDVFDLYFGPLLTSTIYSGVGVGGNWGGAGVEAGVSLGAGINLGADLNLGRSRWSLNGGLKYLALAGGGGSDIRLDPLMITFGVGFRF